MSIEKPNFEPMDPDGQYNINFEEEKKIESIPSKIETKDEDYEKDDPSWEYYGRFNKIKEKQPIPQKKKINPSSKGKDNKRRPKPQSWSDYEEEDLLR